MQSSTMDGLVTPHISKVLKRSEFELLQYDTWILCLQFALPCRASTYIHVLCSCTLRFRDMIHELCLPFSVALILE